MTGYEKLEVWFPCSGVDCHGILYKPAGEGPFPGLVMGMGFGMVKEAHSDDYGPVFAEKGIAVLAFDYRRFGRSQGEPRQALYPEDQVADYRCAVSYMQDLDFIDGNSMCVWGTSFSGGHVFTLLAFPQPGVKCGIAQVPNVYSYKTALTYFGSLEPVMLLAEQGRKPCCRGEPAYIPIVSREGPSVIMTTEAYEYYSEIAGKIPWFENRVTLDSIERVLAYNPGDYAHLINKPFLVILAERDKTTPPSLAREVIEKIPGKVDVKSYDAGHFDIYKPPLIQEIAGLEAEWIKETLLGTTG
ncbi:MAG: alpha/beta hydrolase [Desulfurococcales archaeon]|nr:alpha/beta hydrolase [Desulfurococcales archaeon]